MDVALCLKGIHISDRGFDSIHLSCLIIQALKVQHSLMVKAPKKYRWMMKKLVWNVHLNVVVFFITIETQMKYKLVSKEKHIK